VNALDIPEPPLARAALDLRSAALWTLSALHFFPVGTGLVLLSGLVDPRRTDGAQRAFCRNVVRLAGARLDVRRDPGFDPAVTSLLVCNHVNLFDPFVIYSAIPQYVRGLELESHFRVPVYGRFMERMGNVPVPDGRSSAGVRLMKERSRAALDAGISLIIFAEGTRTRDGRVGRFHAGTFRMAREFGVPLVPMSIVGSFRWKRAKELRLRPSRVTVHLHATIPGDEVRATGERAMMERVHATVRAPLEVAPEREARGR
jgi:1-acyl-sn-glycerol-3-phosphate acyltransferase